MNSDKNRQEIIDRYVLNTLSEDERKDFEKQLTEDPDLRKEVGLTTHISIALQHENERVVIDAMKSVSEDDIIRIINSQQDPVSNKKRSLFISISAVAAIALIILFFGTRYQYSANELYSQYHTPQPYETVPSRGGSELSVEEKALIRQAKAYYEQADYKNALVYYNQLIPQKENWKNKPEEIIFYSAVCQLETDDLTQAIEKLNYLASSGEFNFQEDALWNLAFAHLKENQREKAKECFMILMENKGDYAEKSADIVNKINKRRLF